MAKVRLIGDIHGKWYDYQAVTSEADRSVQVGDFGIGFSGPYWHDRVNEFHADGNHRFIRGNHDSPNKCKEMVGWIPDGTVEDDVMFIGGAWSIDWAYRTEGISWWRNEELSYDELSRLVDVYKEAKPRVMITHDAPYQIPVDLNLGFSGVEYRKTRTALAFQEMFEVHQPDFHFFGHWHKTVMTKINGTMFVCLNELDWVDVDLENSDLTEQSLIEKFS